MSFAKLIGVTKAKVNAYRNSVFGTYEEKSPKNRREIETVNALHLQNNYRLEVNVGDGVPFPKQRATDHLIVKRANARKEPADQRMNRITRKHERMWKENRKTNQKWRRENRVTKPTQKQDTTSKEGSGDR
jgi:hypothetical protein